jgi:hypothetical protein
MRGIKRMDSLPKNFTMSVLESNEDHIIIPFIRSRLDVISTSVYLLEETIENSDHEGKKYLKKINEELEMIRKFINM